MRWPGPKTVSYVVQQALPLHVELPPPLQPFQEFAKACRRQRGSTGVPCIVDAVRRDPEGVLAAARAVESLRARSVEDGAKRRKAAAYERRTHSSPEFEAWVREFAAVQGHLTTGGRSSTLATGPPPAWTLCPHCLAKLCGTSVAWLYAVSSRSRHSRLQELGFEKPANGRHVRRELAPQECCPDVAQCCVLTDDGFDPVRNRCGAARLWRESGSLMQVGILRQCHDEYNTDHAAPAVNRIRKRAALCTLLTAGLCCEGIRKVVRATVSQRTLQSLKAAIRAAGGDVDQAANAAHGLRGAVPRNRVPLEQQRAVVDFALTHTTVHRERMSLQLHTSEVPSWAALVKRFGEEQPEMRVSKATFFRLLQRDERTQGLAPQGLTMGGTLQLAPPLAPAPVM